MSRIFINYRRLLSYHAAARVHSLLAAHFGHTWVFRDDDSFEKGGALPTQIEQALAKCEVFLPLIDLNWETIDHNGTPRLHDPSDWVRREIETVLFRNNSRPAGTEEPILIIPILLNGAEMPKTESLPPSIAPIINRVGAKFVNDVDLQTIIPVIEAFLGDPLVGKLGVRLMTGAPDPAKSGEFRFRAPTSRCQLAPFVAISDDEPDIMLSNPELKDEDRLNLYNSWCQWTADQSDIPWDNPTNATKSFLILEQMHADLLWRPISISIVLPLSPEGGTLLSGTSIEAIRNPASKRTAVTLEAADLCGVSSPCLLLDTWAVACESVPKSGRRRRLNHYNWGVALLLRHIGEFWDPDTTEPICLMAEPNQRVARLLSNLGFERRQRNSASGDLYYIDYPLNPYRYAPEISSAVDRLVQNIKRLRQLPIHRERT